jgi:hypothetical protein
MMRKCKQPFSNTIKMIIDFKEIPPANKGNGEQDRFEQFACDFLETVGYNIIRRPDRGPDGKKDLIVSDKRMGVSGETTIKWLVSCKHYANTGVAVKDTDEPDIYDRVIKHGCQGFMGFYSTLPASTLSDKLFGLRDKIEETTFDLTRIERELMLNNQKERLLASYFPISHDRHRQNLFHDNSNRTSDRIQNKTSLTEEDILRITKTAIIILEIEKIQEKYYSRQGVFRRETLDRLYRFTDHSNEKVASAVFSFLESVSHLATVKMPSRIASSIHSLVFTYFPSSHENERNDRLENGRQCIYIGFNLAYDAFIHLNNFRVAEYGLSIFKFIYQKSKEKGMLELTEEVLKYYNELEEHINRPERNDLGNAKEFVKIFKDDLENKGLGFPDLPEHLFELTIKEDQK